MNTSKVHIGEKIKRLIEESPFGSPLKFYKEIVRRYGDGTISKSVILEACPDSEIILKELIKKKILKDISASEVRLYPNLEKKEQLVKKISKEYFNIIWTILIQNNSQALKQRTLYKILKYRGKPKYSDQFISQIAESLKITFYELIEGTNLEPLDQGPSDASRSHGPAHDPKSAVLKYLFQGIPHFKAAQIAIHGRFTFEDAEIKEGFDCYCLATLQKGCVYLVIKHRDGKVERISLQDGVGTLFNSGEPHYFENKLKTTSKIFLVRYRLPKS